MDQATQTQAPAKLSLQELQALVLQLQERVTALETPKKPVEGAEMTDEHARRILTGDLKDAKHKDAAEKLGLTYGQVYSCRLEYTFKHIHKEMAAAKVANSWKK